MADRIVTDSRRRPDWPAITAVFVLVIGLTYSDDIVEFLAGADVPPVPDLRWPILAFDMTLLAGTAGVKWHMSDQPRRLSEFLRGLLRSWWAVGAGLVLGIHLLLRLTSAGSGTDAKWAVAGSPSLTLLTNATFVLAMGLLLVSALADQTRSPGWILPVVIGTFVAQLASALWYPVIDHGSGCADNVSSEYFNGMVQVLPVFLVTLGLEVNYLRNTRAIRDPGKRAVSVLTVILLCAAEVFAFSMLISGGRIRCGRAAAWHEYIAFVTTVHAAAISLATLAWLLLANTGKKT